MESETGCMIHALDLKQYVTIWASHEGEGGEGGGERKKGSI